MPIDERAHEETPRGRYGREFMDVIRLAYGLLLDHLRESQNAAYEEIKNDHLHIDVTDDPVYNAYFRHATYRRTWPKSGVTETTHYHVHLLAGMPSTLSHLYPAFRFIDNAQHNPGWQTVEVPSEVVDSILLLFARWTEGGGPSLDDGYIEGLSPSSDPAFFSAIAFTEAHEIGHFLLSYDQSLRQTWLEIADKSIASWLKGDRVAKPAKLAAFRQVLADREVLSSWKEELAADMLAYDMCESIEPTMPKYGMAYTNAVQATIITYCLVRGFPISDAHPFCYPRLMVLEEHLRNKRNLSPDAFVETPEWKTPLLIYAMMDRILLGILTKLQKAV